MKYAYIEQHSSEFPVAAMCQAFRVSRSGYYDWRHRGESPRAQYDNILLGHIRHVHDQSRQDNRGVRPSKVDHSSGWDSRSGKAGQPPDSKHRAGGGNSKC